MYISLLFQPSTIFSLNTAQTNFSPSSPSDLTATESFPSLSEPSGSTPPGPKSPSVSSQKTETILKPDTIKSIQELWPDVFLEKIFTSFYLSEPISREPLRPLPSYTDLKSPQTRSSVAIRLSKFKSSIPKSTQLVLPSVSQSQP